MSERKVLAEIEYRDLADLIFILSDQVSVYHDQDECEELTLEQFTEWLCTMKGSVELYQVITKPKGEI